MPLICERPARVRERAVHGEPPGERHRARARHRRSRRDREHRKGPVPTIVWAPTRRGRRFRPWARRPRSTSRCPRSGSWAEARERRARECHVTRDVDRPREPGRQRPSRERRVAATETTYVGACATRNLPEVSVRSPFTVQELLTPTVAPPDFAICTAGNGAGPRRCLRSTIEHEQPGRRHRPDPRVVRPERVRAGAQVHRPRRGDREVLRSTSSVDDGIDSVPLTVAVPLIGRVPPECASEPFEGEPSGERHRARARRGRVARS